MKLRPFSLPVLKAAKTSTMFLLTPMLCFKACSVFQEDWFSACCLLILWSVYILQEEGERWFWSSWFDTFENESDIEADHKNKSSRTFRALLCFVYLQTCGKVLRPIKSQKKKKIKSVKTPLLQVLKLLLWKCILRINLCSLFPVNDYCSAMEDFYAFTVTALYPLQRGRQGV